MKMNKHQMYFFLVTLAFSQMANAATTSTSFSGQSSSSFMSFSKFRKSLKESPVHMKLISDSSTHKDDSDNYRVDGLSQTFYLKTKVDLAQNSSFSITPRYDMTIVQEKDTSKSFAYTVFTYKQEKLIQEEKYGFSLETQLDYRYYTEAKTRNNDHLNGFIAPIISVSKTLTPKLSLSGSYEFRAYDRRTGTFTPDAPVLKYKNIISLTPNYQFTDKFGAYVSFVYAGAQKLGNVRYDELEVYPAVTYSFNKDVSMEVYADLYPSKSGDDKLIAENTIDSTNYGLVLSLTAF